MYTQIKSSTLKSKLQFHVTNSIMNMHLREAQVIQYLLLNLKLLPEKQAMMIDVSFPILSDHYNSVQIIEVVHTYCLYILN